MRLRCATTALHVAEMTSVEKKTSNRVYSLYLEFPNILCKLKELTVAACPYTKEKPFFAVSSSSTFC